ncbi:MAG: hypothetical protein V3T31_08020 [candidate division Zixibacteria bacterium]
MSRKQSKRTKRRIKDIERMYLAFVRVKDIAKSEGITVSSVCAYIRKYGLREKRRIRLTALEPSILSLYAAGVTKRQVAKNLNAPNSYVEKVLRGMKLARYGKLHGTYKHGRGARELQNAREYAAICPIVETSVCAYCSSTYLLCRHHVNGIHTDNRLENLEILCCRCHCHVHHAMRRAAKAEKKRT